MIFPDLYPNDGRRFQFPPPFRGRFFADINAASHSELNAELGWHRRPRSPGLKWHKEYTAEDLKCGRVLMIDYVRKGL